MDEDIIELEGFITFYKYENYENGYKIANFKIDDNKQERNIVIVGYFPRFEKNDGLKLKGKLINHKKYGLQIEVSEIYKKLPTSEDNVIRFLSSNNFKGIGKKIAQKIYDLYKEDTFDKLLNDKNCYEELINLKIIKEKHVASFKDGLKDYDFKSNVYIELLKYGFSLKNIMKIEATYNDDAYNIVNKNPYQLVYDIDGISFKSVDKIALNNGIDILDFHRLEAALVYFASNFSFSSGNTYLSKDELEKGFLRLIKCDSKLFNEILDSVLLKHYLIKEDDRYYYFKLYNAEISIANHLKPLLNSKIQENNILNNFENIILDIEKDEGINYSSEQKEAIYNALSNRLFIISGGPGTGKTTILKAILKIFKLIYGDDANIALCAPTGRAAKRMSYLTNSYSSTIHRLLKWDLHSNTFAYNALNKLNIDVIIIDEFSMVDTLLFSALLEGTNKVSQIILIGDDGQLPSVGAGNLLSDLMASNKVKKIILSHIYRQEEGSSIVSLASLVRNNKLNESFMFGKEVKFIKALNYQAPEIVAKLFNKFLENGYLIDDFQTIIPMYNNVAGIDNINSIIQNMYNPKDKNKEEVIVGHQIFREGDRVLQLKNQPDDDIYNGDIGVILSIDKEEDEMLVSFSTGDIIFTKANYSNLTLAYAVSVHKAQGSEFPYVIMCVFDDYNAILNKQLIYTAISRAKKGLIIIGNYKTFLKKSNEENKEIRKTSLTLRMN